LLEAEWSPKYCDSYLVLSLRLSRFG
jgi:hypothetical protein